ncbi:MAG: dephospho-CoA kinase [Acidobacteriia bacterium]|nr:dephospho-CoA kinase [Terriglobia bacterium]
MHRIGLTGGIACGKTTVCRFFQERGAGIISADEVAHKIILPDGEAYFRIVEEFGRAILNEDGTINRSALGVVVFQSPDLRLQLNGITHPIIIRRTTEMMDELERKGRCQVAIVDAALMVESGSYERFEKLVVVWCEEKFQIERLRRRSGLTELEARQRIAAQMPVSEKRKFADFEINTSGTFQETAAQVENVYRQILSS